MPVTAAMLAALCCVATAIIRIPSPLNGYLNAGDCIVLLAGWLLPPGYAFLAAGLGSALADVPGGYVMYAPATFLIKGLMALTAGRCFDRFRGRRGAAALSGAAAELLMVIGYLAFEGCLYGFVPALANVPANGIQGFVGLAAGTLLRQLLQKTKLF